MRKVLWEPPLSTWYVLVCGFTLLTTDKISERPNLPDLPTFLTHLNYLANWPFHSPDLPTHPDSFSEPTYILFEPTDNLPAEPKDSLSQYSHHNFEKNSQFCTNFTILYKFHNFNQISQFQLNFTISTKFQNFDNILQFQSNFTI